MAEEHGPLQFAGLVSPSSPIPKGCPFVPGTTRVFGASQGAFGERLAADWRTLIQVPEGMSYEAASTLFITYPTSYAALVTRAKLQKDEVGCAYCRRGGCLRAHHAAVRAVVCSFGLTIPEPLGVYLVVPGSRGSRRCRPLCCTDRQR